MHAPFIPSPGCTAQVFDVSACCCTGGRPISCGSERGPQCCRVGRCCKRWSGTLVLTLFSGLHHRLQALARCFATPSACLLYQMLDIQHASVCGTAMANVVDQEFEAELRAAVQQRSSSIVRVKFPKYSTGAPQTLLS